MIFTIIKVCFQFQNMFSEAASRSHVGAVWTHVRQQVPGKSKIINICKYYHLVDKSKNFNTSNHNHTVFLHLYVNIGIMLE